MAKIYITLTLVMLMWGFNLPLLKYLVTVMQPITMTSVRIFIAAITVFIILSSLKLVRRPTKAEWKWILLGASLNVVAHHYFLNMGLARTSATNTGLILGTGPVLTAISVAVIMRNNPSRVQWLGLGSGLFGVSIVVLASGGVSGLAIGDMFIFFAIAVQVLSFLVIAKAAETLDPRLLTAYMLLIGSTVLFIISLLQEPGELSHFADMTSAFWIGLLASAIFGTAVGHMLYNHSVGKVGPSKAAIFINLNTVFSLMGAAIFLGEMVTMRHLTGFLFIVAGVILGSGAAEDMWKKRKARMRAEKEKAGDR